MPELLKGSVVAKEMKAEMAEVISKMDKPPHLVTVLVGDDPASVTYLRYKHQDCIEIGIRSTPMELPAETTAEELFSIMDRLNADPDVDGFFVQIPTPDHIDDHAVMERVDPKKDVDGISPISMGKLMLGEPGFVSATPAGILELLTRYGIPLSGALVGIAGRGPTVGRVLANLISLKGIDATVVLCHSRTKDMAAELSRCDIVVAAMGQPHMITGDYIKEGAVVVDVGQERGPDGKLWGDVDRETVDPKASWITPHIGGVGPMTRIMLLKNVVKAAQTRS